jgi:hypothetical protein
MAKSGPYTKGDPPSSWAIVLVAAVLILLPALFCGGVLLTSSSHTPDTKEGLTIPKRQQPAP